MPQAPQFWLSVGRWTQTPLQSVDPEEATQPKTHLLAEQASPAGQAVPQPPQSAGFDVVSTQDPAQSVSPDGQVSAHLPAPQTWPVGQAVAQAPQLAGSLPVSVQVPLHSVSPD